MIVPHGTKFTPGNSSQRESIQPKYGKDKFTRQDILEIVGTNEVKSVKIQGTEDGIMFFDPKAKAAGLFRNETATRLVQQSGSTEEMYGVALLVDPTFSDLS